VARLVQGQWATVLQLPSVPLNIRATDVVPEESSPEESPKIIA
jgi:hypothetical protein